MSIKDFEVQGRALNPQERNEFRQRERGIGKTQCNIPHIPSRLIGTFLALSVSTPTPIRRGSSSEGHFPLLQVTSILISFPLSRKAWCYTQMHLCPSLPGSHPAPSSLGAIATAHSQPPVFKGGTSICFLLCFLIQRKTQMLRNGASRNN